jgi:hypothetical protein
MQTVACCWQKYPIFNTQLPREKEAFLHFLLGYSLNKFGKTILWHCVLAESQFHLSLGRRTPGNLINPRCSL